MIKISELKPIVYTIYRGEENLGEGTLPELAEKMGVKVSTLRWYLSPAHRRRASKVKRNNKTITLIKVGRI